MNKKTKKLLYVFTAIFIFILLITATPGGRRAINTYLFQVKSVDVSTNYETIKEVEDTCRTMITSYESDKLIYEQYKLSDSDEKQSWAEQAKVRANKTAISYNNFILKNNFIWKNNVPNDIRSELDFIE